MPSSKDVIVKDREILGGTPVFRGTRVPLPAMFDYLEAGETLKEFLEGYPSVSREMPSPPWKKPGNSCPHGRKCGFLLMNALMSDFAVPSQATTVRRPGTQALQDLRMANF